MRGESPSQEQTTCKGSSRWSSVSHIDWDFRAIAVGTAISGRPPHRSVRAELLHTAPTFDADVRSVLQDTDGGYVDWGAIDCRSS